MVVKSQGEQKRDFVKVIYESYQKQKEKKHKQKVGKEQIQAKKEEIQMQEIEALKESMKHAKAIEDGTTKKLARVFKNIFGLARMMVASIQKNNRT